MKCPVCSSELIQREGFVSCEKCGYQEAVEPETSKSSPANLEKISSGNTALESIESPALELMKPRFIPDSTPKADTPPPKPKPEPAAKQKESGKPKEIPPVDANAQVKGKTAERPRSEKKAAPDKISCNSSKTTQEKTPEKPSGTSRAAQKPKAEEQNKFAKRILKERKNGALIIGLFGSAASGKSTLIKELLFHFKSTGNGYELRDSANEYYRRLCSDQIYLNEAARTIRGTYEICEIDHKPMNGSPQKLIIVDMAGEDFRLDSLTNKTTPVYFLQALHCFNVVICLLPITEHLLYERPEVDLTRHADKVKALDHQVMIRQIETWLSMMETEVRKKNRVWVPSKENNDVFDNNASHIEISKNNDKLRLLKNPRVYLAFSKADTYYSQKDPMLKDYGRRNEKFLRINPEFPSPFIFAQHHFPSIFNRMIRNFHTVKFDFLSMVTYETRLEDDIRFKEKLNELVFPNHIKTALQDINLASCDSEETYKEQLKDRLKPEDYRNPTNYKTLMSFYRWKKSVPLLESILLTDTIPEKLQDIKMERFENIDEFDRSIHEILAPEEYEQFREILCVLAQKRALLPEYQPKGLWSIVEFIQSPLRPFVMSTYRMFRWFHKPYSGELKQFLYDHSPAYRKQQRRRL